MKNQKGRLRYILHACQREIRRAANIGKRMVNASEINSGLRELYQELGMLTYQSLNSGELKWGHERVQEILIRIHEQETQMTVIDEEIQKIKKTGTHR